MYRVTCYGPASGPAVVSTITCRTVTAARAYIAQHQAHNPGWSYAIINQRTGASVLA